MLPGRRLTDPVFVRFLGPPRSYGENLHDEPIKLLGLRLR